MSNWPLQEAKTHFSAVIERARAEGPQTITRHGAERAVILSIEDYRALAALKPSFKAHLLGGPKVDDFPIERDSDLGRAVDL
jgi:prevent-host-death family protein